MPEAKTIVKALASVTILPGLIYTAMGLGLLPVEESIEKVAAPFIDPIGLPTKPFFLILGPCKILAGLSFWGIGPMPELVARIGLLIASTCGAIGHKMNDETILPPVIYAGMVASLFVLDQSASKGKLA
eukprot:CAMPEP_0116122834 /NCGR_PEP_ID=MMETSP0329-20121206/4424_1 /TAXON_ID=697910 /ORGANISM="Pseudo-nitzschia arenysensis, Strain B593" /LENGTH=128 /DNA_ID=CAMNT_0003616705 /DNA_START=311 /DNA_END=697 /DNA_ORIENTATION=+